MIPLAIHSTGLVTGVGFNAPASCAAIRVGITGFVETRFMFDGEWLIGCPVPFEEGVRGREKLLRMAAPAIEEALSDVARADRHRIPLLLCLPEPERPGSFAGPGDRFLTDLIDRLGRKFHSNSAVYGQGRLGAVHAIQHAAALLERERDIPHVLIAGVDSLLTNGVLNHYHAQRRLLTADNSDGFIPGEAGSAVLLSRLQDAPHAITAVTGIGFSEEPAYFGSELPLRGDGLTQAIKAAVADAGVTYAEMAYRITDNTGEQFGFKEAALGIARTVRPVKPEFDIEHPTDCIGEVGAAAVPVMLAAADMAERKGYAPGRFMGDAVLGQASALEGPARAAFILRSVEALRAQERAA